MHTNIIIICTNVKSKYRSSLVRISDCLSVLCCRTDYVTPPWNMIPRNYSLITKKKLIHSVFIVSILRIQNILSNKLKYFVNKLYYFSLNLAYRSFPELGKIW